MRTWRINGAALALLVLTSACSGVDDSSDDGSGIIPETIVIPVPDEVAGNGDTGTVDEADGPPDGEDGPQDGDDAVDTDAMVGDTGCEPQCDERVCGDDQCNSTCGECNAGFGCTQLGQCVAAGTSCEGALPISGVPWAGQGDTTEKPDVFGCAGESSGADVVYRFDAAKTGTYSARLTANHDASLAIATDCNTSSACSVRGTDLTFQAVFGEPVTLVVEAAAGTSGLYTLEVAGCDSPCGPNQCGLGKCGIECTCAQGKYCQVNVCLTANAGDHCSGSPVPISALPFTSAPNLTKHTDALACDDVAGDGKDVVYIYTAPTTRAVTATVTGAPDAWVGIDTVCGGCSVNASGGVQVGAIATGGKDLYLIADAGAGAAVNIQVDECAANSCAGVCPCLVGETCVGVMCVAPSNGDSCADAVEVNPGTQTHSLEKMSNTHGCEDGKAAEAFHSFTAPTAATWELRVTADQSLALYTVPACGSESCNHYTTSGRLSLALAAGETVVLAVARLGDGPPPGYTLEATSCTAACAGASCDTEACGTTCGCPAGQSCSAGTCQAGTAGDTCDTATVIQSVEQPTAGTLVGKGDVLGCGTEGGLGTADALFSFVPPSTGTWSAAVVGAGQLVVLLPFSCQAGSQSCTRPGAPKQLLLAHSGQPTPVAVDSLDGAGGSFTLSFSRVYGLAGSLGHGCSTDEDCALADMCVAGVCTVSCAPDGADNACVGAASGPRGSDFGCLDGACPGCPAVCAPGLVPSVCDAASVCAEPYICSAFLIPGSPLATVCLEPGTLLGPGDACEDHSACASGVCATGICREVCATEEQCGQAECHLTEVGSEILGSCRAAPATVGGNCSGNTDCAAEAPVCDAHLLPDLSQVATCRSGGAGVLGASCDQNGECQSGRCLFADDLSFTGGYCGQTCLDPGDCSGDLVCRTFSVWQAGTSDPTDDATLPMCVRGGINQSCHVNGYNLCDDGMVCKDLFVGPIGVCQAPE